jgi:hypothetical protein
MNIALYQDGTCATPNNYGVLNSITVQSPEATPRPSTTR